MQVPTFHKLQPIHVSNEFLVKCRRYLRKANVHHWREGYQATSHRECAHLPAMPWGRDRPMWPLRGQGQFQTRRRQGRGQSAKTITETCGQCGGRGKITCSRCKGERRLLYWNVVVVQWLMPVEVHTVQQSSDGVPADLLIQSHGVTTIEASQPMLVPVSRFQVLLINYMSSLHLIDPSCLSHERADGLQTCKSRVPCACP